MVNTDLQAASGAASLTRGRDHAVTRPAELVLRHGRRTLLRVVADGELWRIEWPDTVLSDAVNLTRAKDAARLWAESKFLREGRKNGAARALKSLDNFSWSSSPIRQTKAA